MTKNISTKSAHRGGHKADKKSSSQSNTTTTTTNTTTNHSQNETANIVPVQKASIDSKMLTPEQRRLASLMNDKVDVTDLEKKINKIIELTGASKDKAIVALHDCANELEKAIDMILEGDSINESEWKSQTRKKKPKTVTGKESDSKVNLNGHAKKSKTTNTGRPARNKTQNDKQFPNRPERTNNKREFKPREQNNNDESTNNKEVISKTESTQPNEEENDEWDDENQSQPQQQTNKPSFNNRPSTNDNQFKSSFKANRESDRERRPINREYNREGGGQRGDRSNYSSNHNRSSYSQSGDRQFNQRGDRKPFTNKNYQPRKPANERNNQYTNSIDTWTNDSTNQATANNDYAQMTVGNWSDVVSSTIQQKTTTVSATSTAVTHDKLNNDEWVETSSNLIEQTSTATKVFSKDSQNNTATVTTNQTTISKEEHQQAKMPNLASIVSGVKPIPQVQQPTSQQSNINKSPNQKTTINQLSGANQTATSNNHPQLTSQQTNLHKSSQQRSPQQNKIDLAALLKSPANQQQQSVQSNQQTNTSNLLNRSNIPQPQRSNDTNAYGAAILQHLQRPQMGNNEANKSSNINDYVNQYNNQQIINKNLVHNIPSNNNFTQNSSNQLFDSRLHHQNVNDQQTIQDHHQKSLIEKTKRRQTKIPETAVEMPSSDHISSLNVQFGALDFGTDSYLNDNNDKQQNSSILSSIRGDNQFRNNQNQSNTSDKQHQQSKDMLHNQLDQHQLQDNILQDNRNKQQQQQTSYQQKTTTTNSLYGNNQATSNDNNGSHQSIYPPNLAQQYGYGNATSNTSSNNQSNYSVNNYGQQNQPHSNNQTTASNQSVNQQKIDQQQTSSSNTSGQKINLKDLDISSSNSNTNNSNLINTSSLGTAATTNVLKNSITATAKNIQQQQSNVAQQPNVAPLLGTPQYIMNMSQPGLSAFYPIVNYDVPQMTADHSFRYNQNQQDVKYNRTDANDSVGQTNPHNVQSTQAQVNQQPNHQIFSQIGQFPHPYGFFYTTGMMAAQGLYPSTAPFLPVQPNAGPPSSNQHTNSNHSTGFPPKAGQNQQYSSYSSNAYDPLTAQLQNQQDYNKAAAQQNYGNAPTQTSNNQQQTGKQMSNSSANELNNSNMYTKSHAQLTKNYDKPGFQTPPPFGITQLSYNPNTYIPMMQPQSNPSMLHHTLQTDANQSVNSSGVAGSQRGSLSQKQTASNSKNSYYNNWS